MSNRYAQNRMDKDLLWVSCDLDSTLAYPVWPEPGIGDPIWENVAKLIKVNEAGYKIIIHTSRPWADYHNIERWLTDHVIPYKEITCGKPLMISYIDDKAINADEESWLPRRKR